MRDVIKDQDVIQRQMHIEHARKEEQLLHQMEEMRSRGNREREMLQRKEHEMAQLRDTFIAKHKGMKEKEVRERARFDVELREKDKYYQEQLDREMKERTMHAKREKEKLEQQRKAQEAMFAEREKKLKVEQDKIAKMKQELESQLRLEEEGRRERERHVKEEQVEQRTVRPSGGVKRLLPDDYSQPRNAKIVKETHHTSPNVTYRHYEASQQQSNTYGEPQSKNNGVTGTVPQPRSSLSSSNIISHIQSATQASRFNSSGSNKPAGVYDAGTTSVANSSDASTSNAGGYGGIKAVSGYGGYGAKMPAGKGTDSNPTGGYGATKPAGGYGNSAVNKQPSGYGASYGATNSNKPAGNYGGYRNSNSGYGRMPQHRGGPYNRM